MRKNITKLFFLGAALLTAAVSGCTDSGMLSEVAKEIKLLEHNVVGSPTSLVPFNGSLYVSCGSIYKKDPLKQRSWEKTDKPKGIVVKLASSKDTLFALVASTPEEDESQEFQLYWTEDGETWKQFFKIIIDFDSDDDEDNEYMPYLFDNGHGGGNGQQGSGRRAFIVFPCDTDSGHILGGLTTEKDTPEVRKAGVFELKTADGNLSLDSEPLKGKTGDDGDTYLLDAGGDAAVPETAVAAAYAGGKTVILTKRPPTPGIGPLIASDGTNMFYKAKPSDTSAIYYSADGENWDSQDVGIGTAYSLAYYAGDDSLRREGKPCLLIGKSRGFEELALQADGTPDGSFEDPDDNSGNQFGSAHSVVAVFAPLVTDTDESAASGNSGAGAIYASTGDDDSSKYDYLWGYYPSRGEWNCE
ncbi:MAG: hypothetical protein NC041_01000 [Bacteroides sp.]|nr:hypothetical protein [Prevotella sp.]MCM1408054.1 hypothetical protein [Treponema brennaborense]MCM1469030.1 hypothetical protein [Bacteroides sp.]